MAISSTGFVIITVALLCAVTALTAARVLPTELASGIFGSLSTAVVLILQRNAMTERMADAMKKASVTPPAMGKEENDG